MEFDLARYRRVVRTVPLVVAGSCIFAWAVGLQGFIQSLPTDPAIDSDIEAVIVLTGGQGRLAAGFQLLEVNSGARLLISGVGAGVRAADLVVPESIESRVDLGRTAANTVGNAVESREWAKERGIARAVLVTSDLHLPRSLLLFRHLAPDIEVVPYPVAGPGDNPHDRSLAWYAAAAVEYSKSIVMRIILMIGGLDYIAGRS